MLLGAEAWVIIIIVIIFKLICYICVNAAILL